MNVNPIDVQDAVSIFSALGFSTKMSLSTIKTMKNIKKLEDDYMRLRLMESKFIKMCEKYPSLTEIDSFSPGLIAVMFEIVTFLRKLNDSSGSSHEGKEHEKLLKKVKKVNIFSAFRFVQLLDDFENKLSCYYFRVAVLKRKLHL